MTRASRRRIHPAIGWSAGIAVVALVVGFGALTAPEPGRPSAHEGVASPAKGSTGHPVTAPPSASRGDHQSPSFNTPGAASAGHANPTTTAAPRVFQIGADRAVGVPPGDYLLYVEGMSTSTPTRGEITQQPGATGAALRVADFHAGTTRTSLGAPVRVTSPADVFRLEVKAGSVSVSRMSLRAASWGYVARGQAITTLAMPKVVLHGINSVLDMSADQVRNAVVAYPSVSIVREGVDEECWDPYFTSAQLTAKCHAYDGGGLVGAAAYQARLQAEVSTLESLGKTVLLVVDDSGRDSATFVPAAETDVVTPDQRTLLVWDDLVRLYGNDPLVMFETFNEPKMKAGTAYGPNHTDGAVLWRDGGLISIGGMTWTAPGEQQIVNRIRSDGATNLVMVEGENWGSDLSPVESNPIDGSNLIYSFHAYREGFTSYPPEMDSRIAPVLDPRGQYRYAGFLSEFGTTMQDSVTNGYAGSTYLSSVIDWAQAHDVGWAAWGWFPTSWGDLFALLRSYSPLQLASKGWTVISRL